MEHQSSEFSVEEQLKVIRETMTRTTAFTEIPGFAMMGIGLLALVVAGLLEYTGTSYITWVEAWVLTALIAILLGAWGIHLKARKVEKPHIAQTARKFWLGLAPAFVVTAFLTLMVLGVTPHNYQEKLNTYWFIPLDVLRILPSLWMLMYGLAISAAGAYSIKAVSQMGLSFLGIGVMTFLIPEMNINLMMMIGFGGLHLIFGWVIAKRYGG
ncbi:MAG TPA: hypothetical protein PLL64_07660 [Rhodothermales bacterium]|nr:hypothetical protein [Bacteroidota bacterium]HRK74135.1 hypothetical protein [Rhodothermales bacterium]HRR08617.1 hypothetical protein [Rhodothermales bacterium]